MIIKPSKLALKSIKLCPANHMSSHSCPLIPLVRSWRAKNSLRSFCFGHTATTPTLLFLGFLEPCLKILMAGCFTGVGPLNGILEFEIEVLTEGCGECAPSLADASCIPVEAAITEPSAVGRGSSATSCTLCIFGTSLLEHTSF